VITLLRKYVVNDLTTFNTWVSMGSTIIHKELQLPYENLNLRFNPFGELPNEDRCLCSVVDCDEWVRFLKNKDRAVQFIGKSGCGKTTHCLSLQHHFSDAEYFRVPFDGRIHGSLMGDPLVLDELQFLSERMRSKIFKCHRRLIIGTHTDLNFQLVKAGFEVLTIYPEQMFSVHSLHSIVNKRIEFARRAEGELPVITFRTVEKLFSRYGSNVRAVEHELYILFQKLKRIEHV
jgi:ABC-type glutathione transport system ATPase component